jgi:hypothetical protein
MALATKWQVTMRAMARVARVIITIAIGDVAVILASDVAAAIFIAAAATTIA